MSQAATTSVRKFSGAKEARMRALGGGQRATDRGPIKRQQMAHRGEENGLFRAKVMMGERSRHARAPGNPGNGHVKRTLLANFGNCCLDQ